MDLLGIADYDFLRPLGGGDHGQCFLARRPPRVPVEAEVVVVKVLHRGVTPEAFRRAARDLRAFAAVRSPYLLGLYEAGQHEGLFYQAAEFVPGGSLGTPAQPLDAALAVRAVSDAARAASALHAAGLVHGGIKPGNVLLDPYGAKLADLDLTPIVTPGLVGGAACAPALEFVDPGRLLGEPAAPAHDVWSLGALLHRVAAGAGIHGVLAADDPLAALRRVVGGRPEISPALPGHLANIVRECLAPADRRPTAAALADRLVA